MGPLRKPAAEKNRKRAADFAARQSTEAGFLPEHGPKLRLASTQNPQYGSDSTYSILPDFLHGSPIKVEESNHQTSRSGRVIRKPKNNEDYATGQEMEKLIQMNARGKIDSYQSETVKSLPHESDIHQAQVSARPSKRQSVRAPKCQASQALTNKVDEEYDRESSETIGPSSPDINRFRPKVQEDVYKVMENLRKSTNILIELPELADQRNLDVVQPYSATLLIHLYTTCYQNEMWNLCDLIVDTWIRAFHELRKKSQKNPRYQLWQPNKVLEKRQREMEEQEKALARLQGRKVSRIKGVGFDDHAPDYQLEVDDPPLEDGVTDFDSVLLSDLYRHTKEACGARLVWSDAMALGGDKVENMMDEKTKQGETWHPELVRNIMDSSLRMVRRKLTLKIEEASEGAWCNRYHEHGKHGLPCYRELAWKHKQALEEDMEIESEED